MRVFRFMAALCVAGASLLHAGCALVATSVDTVVTSTCRRCNDHFERKRNREWAEAAWATHCGANPAAPYSEAFGDGFKEGFADYLYQGGDGEPPPLPPEQYRKPRYQTPQGYQAIEQWFVGYREGAGAAKASGSRDWITGPSSLRATGIAPAPTVVSEFTSPHPEALPTYPTPVPLPVPPQEEAPPSNEVAPPEAQRNAPPPSAASVPTGASAEHHGIERTEAPAPATPAPPPNHSVFIESPAPVAAPPQSPAIHQGPAGNPKGVYFRPSWRPWPWQGGRR